MPTITQYAIEEQVVPGKRLGRTVLHDPRSWAYPYGEATTLVSTLHKRYAPIFDQGNLGSCTGNAALGALGTDPLYPSNTGRSFTEQVAVDIYGAATVVDEYAGTYPPEDTGSNGLSVAKVCQARGWISGYQHAFSLTAALTALQSYPILVGSVWLEGMDNPDSNGLVKATGAVRGGHEYEGVGVDVAAKTVRFANSWGPEFGDNGYFQMSWSDLETLLAQDGDVTVLIPNTAPAPSPITPADEQDKALVAALDPWERTVVSRLTTAGKAKRAYDAWKLAKGL